jgi:hypothetical protein
LGIDFGYVRALVFGLHDERQIQDMRRSGAAKMATTLASSNRLHRTYVPIDVTAVRDVDDARALGRERTRGKKLQLRSAMKLQPK